MASDDLRARIAEALCPPHHRVGSFSSGGPVTALSPCLLHQAQADTVAALVQPELDRRSAPSRPCKHGVLPEQGLCLYCASEQRATVPGVDACHEIRHCVMWGFCHRCAPELAAEASRLYGHTGGSPEAYAAIVKGLTEPVADPQPVGAEFFTELEKTGARETDDLHGWYAAMDDQPTSKETLS